MCIFSDLEVVSGLLLTHREALNNRRGEPVEYQSSVCVEDAEAGEVCRAGVAPAKPMRPATAARARVHKLLGTAPAEGEAHE